MTTESYDKIAEGLEEALELVKKINKKPRENRVPIMMSDEELTAIDDWRFGNRVATRSDAVRRLCQIALTAANGKNE